MEEGLNKENAGMLESLLRDKTLIKEITIYSDHTQTEWFLVLKADLSGQGVSRSYFATPKYRGHQILSEFGLKFSTADFKDEDSLFFHYKTMNVEFG